VGDSFVSSAYQTVAYSTLIEHWNGSSWSVVPSPNHNTDNTILLSVTAVSSTDAWAVGYYYGSGPVNVTITEHWDGSHWVIVDIPNIGTGQDDLPSISASSSDDVWAVGDYISGTIQPLTEHWTGSSWNVVPNGHTGTSTNSLFGVSARSANDVWAVGHYYNDAALSQTLAEHWNGSAWSVVPTTDVGTSHNWLVTVSAADASDAWAAGWYYSGSTPKTLIERWNGSVWGTVTSPSPGTWGDELQGVAAVYAGDVWAVGYSNDTANTSVTLIERYNPCGPSPTPTNTPRPTNTPGGPTSTPSPIPSQCALNFEDVPNPSTFYAYVQCLACRGIINGYACGGVGEPCNPAHDPYFRPNRNVTRGQIAKIVALSKGIHTAVSGQTFEDVPPGTTFYTYTEQLYALQVMNGYPCGGAGEPCNPPNHRPYFRPNANATRGQLAKIDANAAGYQDTPSGQTFEDVVPGSTFYTYTQRLTSRGVMGGYPCGNPEPCVPPGNRPYFRPNADVTRGQTSKIVSNTFYPNCQPPSVR
jgi:hypothetical protein